MTSAADVQQFLTALRGRVTPDHAGLTVFGGERRVLGLRRNQVAQLAGVSTTYHTRMERGDLSGVSDSVLHARVRRRGLVDDPHGVKRRTRETDEPNWRVHILPRFGKRPVHSITTAEVSEWAGGLVEEGRSAATAKRSLATFRSILGHTIADDRLIRNVAATATVPKGRERREGQALTLDEVESLAGAARDP